MRSLGVVWYCLSQTFQDGNQLTTGNTLLMGLICNFTFDNVRPMDRRYDSFSNLPFQSILVIHFLVFSGEFEIGRFSCNHKRFNVRTKTPLFVKCKTDVAYVPECPDLTFRGIKILLSQLLI